MNDNIVFQKITGEYTPNMVSVLKDITKMYEDLYELLEAAKANVIYRCKGGLEKAIEAGDKFDNILSTDMPKVLAVIEKSYNLFIRMFGDTKKLMGTANFDKKQLEYINNKLREIAKYQKRMYEQAERSFGFIVGSNTKWQTN